MTRKWKLLLTGPEHGIVMALDADDSCHPEHYERVAVTPLNTFDELTQRLHRTCEERNAAVFSNQRLKADNKLHQDALANSEQRIAELEGWVKMAYFEGYTDCAFSNGIDAADDLIDDWKKSEARAALEGE